MGVTSGRAQDVVGAVVRLDHERESTAGPKGARDGWERDGQVADVDDDVRGQDEVE